MKKNLKKEAAIAAMEWIKPNMKLGLGTGSTANELVHLIGDAVAEGLTITCIPTSKATYELAKTRNIPLATLDEEPLLDLTIDGADEITPDLSLIKGGGGAHLREKIVACASKAMLVIADESKRVEKLGTFPLPLEVLPFGLRATKNALEDIYASQGYSGSHGSLALRQKDGAPFVTDNGNYILDASMGYLDNPQALVSQFATVPGLIEHGFFLGIATAAIIAGNDGIITLKS